MFFHKLFQPKLSEDAIDYHLLRQEKLTEIGKILKEKRLELNLSEDMISNQIHIPLSTLKAIENADLTHLPEPFFIQQIIKKYANYLQLNGGEISEGFPLQTNKKNIKKYHNKLRKFNLNISLSPKYLYFIYFLLLLFSIKSLSNILQFNQFQEAQLPPLKVVETDNPQDNHQIPKAIPAIEKQEETQPQPTELNLKLTIKQDAWVKIIVDGKPVYEGILNQGTQKEWIAKEKLTIRTGNAGGVLVSLNEEKARELGKLGQVEEVTFEVQKRS